jgi:hypothetical protein
MERPMFNRLSGYAQTEILSEYGLSSIRNIDGLSNDERESLITRLRQELNMVLEDLISELDNEALGRLRSVLKKHWKKDNIDLSQMTDYDCILIHNYIHGRHCIQ